MNDNIIARARSPPRIAISSQRYAPAHVLDDARRRLARLPVQGELELGVPVRELRRLRPLVVRLAVAVAGAWWGNECAREETCVVGAWVCTQ